MARYRFPFLLTAGAVVGGLAGWYCPLADWPLAILAALGVVGTAPFILPAICRRLREGA